MTTKARGKKLPAEVQVFIVRALAQYATPTEVVEMVKEEFGLELSKQQVHHYDPDHGEPAKRWRDLHAEIRTKFKTDLEGVGIAHIGVRLRQLDRMVKEAVKKKNYPLANDLLTTAAKEVGGAFTNKKDIKVGLSIDDLLMQAMKEEQEAGDGGTAR